MRNRKFANLYVALVIFCLIMALCMKLVKGTELDNFLTEHNLEFPREAKEQIAEQNLVAGAGIMNNKEQIFTVFFLPKPLTFDIEELDLSKTVMQVAFHLTKKKVVVEYITCKECQRAGKCWPNNRVEKIYFFLELYPL